ncbi:MAG TPA: ABC transporter permease [Accumulibacter sp.]|jgi:putative ABC transport system permease protein|nr:ABC transporter permease [Accumulibacter sp.]HQC80082.1 ABC transporter permease [Accumulibacter sp.]
MNTLAWWLIRAQFRTRRVATSLSMLAIALGVALGYAIHLINAAALADFSRAMNSVQGEPDAVIVGRDSAGSVPLTVVEAIARDPAVQSVVPVIDTRVRLAGAPAPLRLIGLDVFSAATMMPKLMPRQDATATDAPIFAGGVFASPAVLRQLNAAIGDTVTLQRGDRQWTTRLAGDLPALGPDERLLVADIAWVQAHFGPDDAVGEARVRLTPDTDPAAWRDELARRLPPGLLLRAADDENARVSNLSLAYRVNLNVLALVALLTGAFLVFATQLTAVAQRSTQFALLGVLGLSPRRRLLQVLLEGLAIGVPGALLGLALGYALALAFTRLLGGDLGGGFFSTGTTTLVPAPLPALGFLALGALASLAGAVYPAYLNRRQALAHALHAGFAQTPRARPARPLVPALRLLALALLAGGLSRLPAWSGLPLAGYAAIAVLLVIGIAAAPWLTRWIFGLCAGLPLPATQRIALQNVAQAPLMAQVAAGGLIVSFALTASMVIMVGSFRVAVDRWLDDVLPAPLYLRSKATPLPEDLLAALARPDTPFARVEGMAHATLTLDPRRPNVTLIVRELDRLDPAARLPFTGPLSVPPDETLPVVWISEPLREIYGIAPGQTLRLPLLGGSVEVFVGGVWRDYSRQFGAVTIGADDYRRLGGRFQANDLALWPRPGQNAAAETWLAPYARRDGLEVAETAEIRQLSLAIFDKSFAVTYALEAAAMLIGLFGLAVTLAAGVWLRARELATLGALGFNRRMLGRAVTLEGALIAIIGLLIGLACGVAIGAVLTHVVNPQAFHWRMPLHIPWPTVLGAAALTLAAAIAASHAAARQATRLPLAQVLAGSQ